MSKGVSAGAAAEWRGYWYLPLIAALGFSSSGLQTHAMGPFIGPLQQEFGWSRAEISSGITICMLFLVFLVAPMGALIDRWGPRRVAIGGVILMPLAFALLGTATGSMTNWRLLWLFMGFAGLWVPATVWTSAVASRFDAGRGMALAVTLSGGSLTALILPPVSTLLIQNYGWQKAFMGVGALWALLLFPLVFLFFRGTGDVRRDKTAPAAADTRTGLRLSDGLRMPAFYALLLAGGSFTFCMLGIIVHLIPILTDNGAAPMRAAGLASLAAAFAIAGRLGTGALLDRFPGHIIGAAAYLVPTIGCLLLLTNGESFVAQALAAAIFGLTMGSELDVITYLATRYFGLRNLGVMLGAILSAVFIGLAFGPLVAGATFDRYGSYDFYLMGTMVLMVMSGLSLLSLRKTPVHG